MTPEQFNYLRSFLKERSGLVLGEDKRYLLDSRLNPVAQEFGFADLGEMVTALRRPGSQQLAERITGAMTINESFFFRDMTPFDNFRNTMLPHMLKARAAHRRLRIWSAAASTGQEGYSLAIELLEQKNKIAGWKIEILGTDLSPDALKKAKAGVYSQFEVQRGMPTPLLMKYFRQQGSEWAIEPSVKSMVDFKTFNLLKDFRSLGVFDIVFCRNVLIYFDRDTKSDILDRMARQMAPDGYLVLGAAETIMGLCDEFKAVPGVRGLYQRDAKQATAAARPFAGGSAGSAPKKAAPLATSWKDRPVTPAATQPRAAASTKTAATGSMFSKTRRVS